MCPRTPTIGLLGTTSLRLSPFPLSDNTRREPRRDLSMMRWGLIPSWAKNASGAAGMINARSETAHSLPAFRDAMKLRRCLIPADGFYEWQKKDGTKQPFCFAGDCRLPSVGLFSFRKKAALNVVGDLSPFAAKLDQAAQVQSHG